MKRKYGMYALGFLSFFLVWAFVRFVLVGSEDDWICENGEWVKQGHPVAPKPREGCAEELDEISQVLVDFEERTKIAFWDIEDVEFVWRIEGEKTKELIKTEEISIKGKGFGADGVSSEQHSQIRMALSKAGFEQDIYNVGIGKDVDGGGFQRGQIVCLFGGERSGENEEKASYNVRIRCGSLRNEEEKRE